MLRKVDVAIVGAGAMGLWLALILTLRGYLVGIIESQPQLASGPSTRNEGWLHRGTYHAAAIGSRSVAVQVASRTIIGHNMTLQFCPEAREELDCQTFALLRSENMEEVVRRWDMAEVFYRPVCKNDVQRLEPTLKLDRYDNVFEVADVAINSRKVYEKLVAEIWRGGSTILTGTKISSVQNQVATLQTRAGTTQRLHADVFVCAAGYGIGQFFASALDIKLPVRYFVSHLLDVPRFARHCFFGLESNDITAMHHGEWTIVGFTKDQVPVASPIFEANRESVDQIKIALKAIASGTDFAHAIGRACTKVDIDYSSAVSPGFGNLNIAYGEPVPGMFWVLPGKMTESAYAARELAGVIGSRLGSPHRSRNPSCQAAELAVALRPIDTY